MCLLQNQSDELHEQLDDEQTRSDGLEDALDEALLSLDEHKAEVELAQNQIRTQSREVANLKVSRHQSRRVALLLNEEPRRLN